MSTATPQSSILGEEIAFYEEQRAALIKDYLNKFVLIKGREVVESFDDEATAIREGTIRYGTTPFLVRRTGDDTPIVSIPALSLGVPLCQV